MLTAQDIQAIQKQHKNVLTVENQLERFKNGIPASNLVTAATIDNGILKLSTEEKEALITLYETEKEALDIVKFVPASGAATRMFAHLQRFVNEYDPEEELINTYLKQPKNKLIKAFFEGYKYFPFVNKVRKAIRENHPEYKKLTKGPRFLLIAKTILHNPQLNYSQLPKGLIPFHRYTKIQTTAFEEQLFEGAYYAAASDEVKVHFTFSEKHADAFKTLFNKIKNRLEKKTKVEFQITYSFQKPTTDTITVLNDNTPLRDEKNKLVFRPGGHGALIENLNQIDASIIFIKNIDNVVTQDLVPDIAFEKQVLAGKLIEIQKACFAYLRTLETATNDADLSELKSFVWNTLHCKSNPTTVEDLQSILNRPIRVCGVVENTGAPGGGPFWVEKNGDDTLQIVEKAQVDAFNESQLSLFNESTHFNPVDIVCGTRDYKGNPFNLLDFIDAEAGFITEKTYSGTAIKAQELPGLWNGAMANWNTIFIEVPLSTFNPVKTVNDLLAIEHQPLL